MSENGGKPHLSLVEVPASREPVSLLAVDRAISELRRGRFVAIRGNNGTAALAQAAEGLTQDSLDQLAGLAAARPALSITQRRAEVLGLAVPDDGKIVTIATDPPLTAPSMIAFAEHLGDADFDRP
ncbi:MAG: hypothetical protein OXR84_04425, partial [Magnetovibrio sp.]|nr:hypothetical protein [Magnetovibrio sp.]